jgi:hypothetical protein
MWKSFCPQNDGVALVINSAPFTAISDVLGAFSFPVSCRTEREVDDHFGQIAANIQSEMELVKNYPDRSRIEWMVHELLRFEMLCTKHSSFLDEREWRIVYAPDRDVREPKPLAKSVEKIGAAPQPIYSIPLEPLSGYDISIPAILDRVIIGPAKFPDAVFESFEHELEQAGVKDARQRIFYSGIPLRP